MKSKKNTDSTQTISDMTTYVMSNTLNDKDLVELQLNNDRLVVDFDRFHAALSVELGRSIHIYEFSDMKALKTEYYGIRGFK